MVDSTETVRTPVTEAGLRQFDYLPPAEAVVRSWVDTGPMSNWHQAARKQVRNLMPLLVRAIERLASQDPNTESVRGTLADTTCSHGRPDHQVLICQLAEALGLDLPAMPDTPAQVWHSLLAQVRSLRGGLDGCEHCGRPTLERYCDNDCRRVDKSGLGPCKVHGDECPTLIDDAG